MGVPVRLAPLLNEKGNAMHIAVDLDGTLAVYNPKDKTGGIGEPIPQMVERVREWKANGHKVYIFTARVSYGESERARARIYSWLEQNGISVDGVTANKERKFAVYYDDKAFHVSHNTGEICPTCHSGGREPL